MLNQSKVIFYDITHSYQNEDGKYLLGVTSLMKKHGLSPDYSNIPEHILNKAAEKGSKIHKDIENYCLGNAVEETEEIKLFSNLKLQVIANEYIISDNELVASAIDLVLEDNSLADLKTTSTLHTDSLAWQLSIYAYLFELQNPTLKVPHLYGIHIKGGKAEKVEVRRIPSTEIQRLLECEADGELFTPFTPPSLKDDNLAQLYDLEKFIIDIEAQAKEAKETKEKLLAKLYEEMETNDIKKLDTEFLSITRILPGTRKSVDTKKLESDYPSVYSEVLKTSETKGSIRIKIK